MNANGIWYSSVGSKLILEESGCALTGTFQSTEAGGEIVPIYGSIDPDQALAYRPLSFSASWGKPATPPGQRSVTSYSGQYRSNDNGREVIEVIFLLVDDTRSNVLWKSTHICTDLFTRTSHNK